jgi:hypothetical protein
LGLTFFSSVSHEIRNEFDDLIRVQNTLLDWKHPIDHIYEEIVEGFLSRQLDTASWNDFVDFGALCLDLVQANDIFSMGS